jgi:hypothetical protein
MPQEQAEAMVPVALKAIRCRTQKQWADDVPLAFFWWSNVQMFRVFLHQLGSGAVSTQADCSWLQPMLDPGLQVRTHVVNAPLQGVRGPLAALQVTGLSVLHMLVS